MSVEVKICGLSNPEGIAAAVNGGAAMVGFNFFAKSPRYVTPDQARTLGLAVPEEIIKVALLVDPGDDDLEAVLSVAPHDLLQLHGDESPERVAAIKARWGLPVMKVLKIQGDIDLGAVAPYLPVADRLLFDPKVPKDRAGALPGGNALAFDWRLLAGRDWPLPWMLAGGLTVENLAEAVRISGARAVDLSSGVEDAPGRKSPEKIRAFLALADGL